MNMNTEEQMNRYRETLQKDNEAVMQALDNYFNELNQFISEMEGK